MSQIITLTTDCTMDDCDGRATDGGTLHLEANPPEPIELDIEMTVMKATLAYSPGDATWGKHA